MSGTAARLALLGAISVPGYVALVIGPPWTSRRPDVLLFLGILAGLFAVYALAGLIARRGLRRTVWVILLFAGLFRALLVFAGLPPDRLIEAATEDLGSRAVSYRPYLLYDNDVWRYLWDGHVAACGTNPYRFSPNEIEDREQDDGCSLDSDLWWDVFDRVSYSSYRTVYPPVSQYHFRLVHALAPGSVMVLKASLALLDLGTCVLLVLLLGRLGRPPGEVLLYAWNPLVVKEFAGSGHVDALMVFLLVLTVHLLITNRARAALVAFAASILAKLAPILIMGLVLRRSPRRAWPWLVVSGGLLTLPLALHLDGWLRGTIAFARSWEFNAGPWHLAAWAFDLAVPGSGGSLARGALGLIALGAAAWWTWKDPGSDLELVRRVALILGTLALLGAAVMPWYLLWALPFFVLAGWRSWILLTALSVLSYLTYIDQTEHAWWLLLEYGLFGAAAGLEWSMKTRSGIVKLTQ